MFFVEHMVDASVELVLAIRLDGGADELVGGPGKVRQGVMLENLRRDRVEAAGGNGVGRKGSARSRVRIVNCRREYAAALRDRRDRAEARQAGKESGALPVREEEGLVLANGTAQREAVLVSPELRARPGLGKIIARI